MVVLLRKISNFRNIFNKFSEEIPLFFFDILTVPPSFCLFSIASGGKKLNYKNIFISFLLRQVVVPANTGSKKVIVY